MFDYAPTLRRRLRSLGAAGVAAAIALLAACGDDATSQQATDRSTTTAESTAGLTDSDSASGGSTGNPTAGGDAGTDVSTGGSANDKETDETDVATDDETDVATNSRGVEITLDDPALLACAQNQLAWAALRHDGAGNPADALDLAADHAESSAVAEVKAEAPQLRSAADGKDRDVTVDRFLELCVSNGFEY